MPIQTRCPACSAAVPANAAWCSLCHADLRHRVEPPTVDLSSAPVARDDTELVLEDALGSAGRHTSGAPVPRAESPSSGGRHAAGRHAPAKPSPAASHPSPEAVMEGIELPTDGELTPEAVDALADQMLRRLAVTEKSAGILDPDNLPGGKWGFTAGLMVLIVVAMVAVATVLGIIISR